MPADSISIERALIVGDVAMAGAFPQKASLSGPELAIVIPVFKHSGLVTEAIACALREARCSRGVVIIVNDGCPYEETHHVCAAFASAEPLHVNYIRTPNGGLSVARNRGIQHALSRYPSVQAVYLLDADNRLSAGAMRRALATMEETKAAWVYPNIDKFGLEWSGDFTADHSVLRQLFQNSCEAGSLIHRRVFDAGIYFDESMRQGYEDWEFWLQCCEAGFRGAPCAQFGFQYRARRESMVRNSDREGAAILAYMHRKHKKLFSWKNILRLEHEEAPRFCVIDTVQQRYAYTSIPGERTRHGDLVDLDQQFWHNDLYPSHVHFPNFVVVLDRRIMAELVRLKIADGVFWQIEDALEQNAFVFVTLGHLEDGIVFSVDGADKYPSTVQFGPHIVAAQRRILKECATDEYTSWIDSIRTVAPDPKVGLISFEAPFSLAVLNRFGVRNALASFFHFFHQLRASPFKTGLGPAWEWRDTEAVIPSADLFRRLRSHMNALGPLARCSTTGENEIAFILPIVSFGGVEQVGIQVARQFKAAGWRTRLIVTERNEVKAPSRFADAFDCILFLNDASYNHWQPSGMKYYGHELQKWPVEGRHDRLIGLLAGCGAVMVLQANHGYEVMGWLKRQGVVTINSLHLIDRDILGAPVGHPYLTLGYEHAFDIVTAPSHKLLAFCAASGVPEQKLLYLANAPTFSVSHKIREARLRELAESAATGAPVRPLRVLSLGRLDRQKGVERISALVQFARTEGLPIEWRFVGGRIVEEAAGGGAQDTNLVVEAPVYDRAKVIERLLWADAVVLLSHWEGSPLLILEAQSLGTIPIATDVGAVCEMIRDGETGILLPNGSAHSVVEQGAAALRQLAANPALRERMAISAILHVQEITWANTGVTLVQRVIGLATPRTSAA